MFEGGGKTITFSSRQNVNDVERSVGPSVDPTTEVYDNDVYDNNSMIDEDEQEYAKMMEEGD